MLVLESEGHLGPVDPQHLLVHVHGPQVAGALCGVWWEFPAAPLLVVAQFMDGPPHAAPHAVNADQLVRCSRERHDGITCMHPACVANQVCERCARNVHINHPVHPPWEICTSVTMRSLRPNLGGRAARSAMAAMMAFQSAASSSGRSRSRTVSEGTVMTMLSNSISAQGEGAVRSRDQSAAVVTPEGTNADIRTFSTSSTQPEQHRHTGRTHSPDL